MDTEPDLPIVTPEQDDGELSTRDPSMPEPRECPEQNPASSPVRRSARLAANPRTSDCDAASSWSPKKHIHVEDEMTLIDDSPTRAGPSKPRSPRKLRC